MQIFCDDACIDPTSDGDHCGDCGIACDDGEKCIEGECDCRPELTRCAGECVDTFSDPVHCGGCGQPCGADFCGNAECHDSCDGLGTACDQSCVNLETNPLHCSECFHACNANDECRGGDCEG